MKKDKNEYMMGAKRKEKSISYHHMAIVHDYKKGTKNYKGS